MKLPEKQKSRPARGGSSQMPERAINSVTSVDSKSETTATPVSIDKQPLPEWVKFHLTEKQLNLAPLTLWIKLIYMRTGWEASHVNVAQFLYVNTAAKRKDVDKKDWHGTKTIAQDLNMSRQTVITVLKDLVAEGWVTKVPRRGSSSELWPAWPQEDCLTPIDGPELCAIPTGSGKLCTRRAGWGTGTPGEGPCKLHRATEPVQPLDTLITPAGAATGPDTCPTVGHPPAQPLDTPSSNGLTRRSSYRATNEDSSSSPPYVAEVEGKRAERRPKRIDDKMAINEEGEPDPIPMVSLNSNPAPAVDHEIEQAAKVALAPLANYGCTHDEARAVVRLIAAENNIRTTLARYVAGCDNLHHYLREIRRRGNRQAAQDWKRWADKQPHCPHGISGGRHVNPHTERSRCPYCAGRVVAIDEADEANRPTGRPALHLITPDDDPAARGAALARQLMAAKTAVS